MAVEHYKLAARLGKLCKIFAVVGAHRYVVAGKLFCLRFARAAHAFYAVIGKVFACKFLCALGRNFFQPVKVLCAYLLGISNLL